MAIIKLAEDKSGNVRKYITECEVRNLIDYVIRKSSFTLYNGVQNFMNDTRCIADQILFLQKCYGKPMASKMIHMIISFNTDKYEVFVKREIESIIYFFENNLFTGYQKILCLHTDKPTHWHIHFLVNPVNPETYRIVSYYMPQIRLQMAFWLDGMYHIAVQGATYYDEKGKLQRGVEEGRFLYQNRKDIYL